VDEELKLNALTLELDTDIRVIAVYEYHVY
jgi:hypothetical protein